MIKHIFKIFSAVISFSLIFLLIQPFFSPKFVGEASTMVDGLKQLDNPKLDVLFLGSSQMFCAVDAKTLTEKYNIASYNYGASSQPLSITEYYLNEALEYCKPKMVLVELGNLYYSNSQVDDTALTWNYAPTDMSLSKYNSVFDVTKDIPKSLEHTLCPLLLYHSRWSEISNTDVNYYLNYYNSATYKNRGFLERNEIASQRMQFLNGDKKEYVIPDENKRAIKSIVKTCSEKGIKVVFFKIPVPFWTLQQSVVMKKELKKDGVKCIDFFDYIDDIHFDEKKDFRDDHHLNVYGASKFTSFLGKYIKKIV